MPQLVKKEYTLLDLAWYGQEKDAPLPVLGWKRVLEESDRAAFEQALGSLDEKAGSTLPRPWPCT